uniref:Collagen alpha-1(I) chain-like n=1 Tax=Phascolarctos cinereus TaxID=38626 RepID=A0A6P5JVW3_PHACI|nr:collagen alpha-1(I) chain-like [Phascolarctos cinereus]
MRVGEGRDGGRSRRAAAPRLPGGLGVPANAAPRLSLLWRLLRLLRSSQRQKRRRAPGSHEPMAPGGARGSRLAPQPRTAGSTTLAGGRGPGSPGPARPGSAGEAARERASRPAGPPTLPPVPDPAAAELAAGRPPLRSSAPARLTSASPSRGRRGSPPTLPLGDSQSAAAERRLPG